jgi:hypothetical protein
MGLTKPQQRQHQVPSTSKQKLANKSKSSCPLQFDEPKPSLSPKEFPFSLRKGRTLTASHVESLSLYHSKLTRKQYRALPSATRSKLRSTIRRHFHHLLKSEPSWIYIILNPAWPEYCKIGVSNDIKHRVCLYNTHSPFGDFTCVYAEFFHEHDRYIAQMYEHFGSQRAEGEWFKVSASEATAYLSVLKEKSDVV